MHIPHDPLLRMLYVRQFVRTTLNRIGNIVLTTPIKILRSAKHRQRIIKCFLIYDNVNPYDNDGAVYI